MKIVFMGTPEFAAGALEALLACGHEIPAVVTQPDRPKGRSGKPQFSPVKETALKYQIPVLQPVKIKTPEAIRDLKEYEAEIYVIAAFGQILSQEILDIPDYGAWCIHASLLPKYRGASPIQHAIIAGEEKTGITIMQMDAGIDTGDMLYKREVIIDRKDTYATLHNKLMEAGGAAITMALTLFDKKELIPEKQDDALSSYAPIIKKGMGEIDFSRNAIDIERLVRGMNPWPSAYTFYQGRQLKLWEAEAVDDDNAEVLNQKGTPGTITEVEKDSIIIAAGTGRLKVYSMQMEGKKRMSTHDFLLGVKIQKGEKLAVK